MKKLLLFIFAILYISQIFSQVEVEISSEKTIIDGEKFYLHTVQPGQTIYSISKAYSVSEEDIYKYNPGIENSTLKSMQVIKIPIDHELSKDNKYIIYVVKPGDTVYSLCKKFGISQDEFFEINTNLNQRKTLRSGTEVKFPAKVIDEKIQEKPLFSEKDTSKYIYHIIEKGETVYRITKTYNISKETLMELNPDFDGSTLYVGNVLIIPKEITFEPISENTTIIDSLSEINKFNEEDYNICDRTNWYENGNKFEITIFLPFDITSNMRMLYNQEIKKQEQRLSPLSEKIISFYSGILVGFENFKNENISATIKTFDTGKDISKIQKIIETNDFDNTNIVIGPAFNSQVEYINKFLKDDNLIKVIPFISNDSILINYNNNIFLNSPFCFIAEAIADYAHLNRNKNYFIIQYNNAEDLLKADQIYTAIKQIDTTINVEFIKFSGDHLQNFRNQISKETENVFILPFYEETKVTRVFLELFTLKDYPVRIIGDKSLLDYENIDPKYYTKSNFTYFTNTNIDYEDPKNIEMIKKYREIFLCEPDEYSFLGYDAINFFLTKLHRHGEEFYKCISSDEKYIGLSGCFNFDKKANFLENSWANRNIYMFSINPDFTFSIVYPQINE